MIKPLLIAAAVMLAAPALAQTPATPAAARPSCSVTITDGCQQTKMQQASALTGVQADARDARNGGKWTPDSPAKAAPAVKKAHAVSHKKKAVRVTKVEAAKVQAAPAAAPK